MKAALYLRVSTTEQNVDNQLPALEAYAESRGWQIVETYRENESAWRAGHQRELARLLADIRGGKRKYDVLLIWALDRLSRQGIGPLLQLINSFEVYGCHVVSVNESWTHPDAGPMREMFIAMSAWAAKFESDRRSERTKAGLARAIANGKKLGRPAGKKDKGKRKRTGYLLRYANKR
ncbi:MAG: recombinase family protein [Chloroflexi bacterium]|nr:recombinase family protein [Chloroflexota bacterium]